MPQLIDAEARRAQRSAHPDAMDLYFQGRAHLNKTFTPESLAQARAFFERVLLLDPNNIEAFYGCAAVDFHNATNYFADDRMGLLTAAEMALINVLSRAPDHAGAHALLGGVHTHKNRAARHRRM